jgi:hypothetical protein
MDSHFLGRNKILKNFQERNMEKTMTMMVM